MTTQSALVAIVLVALLTPSIANAMVLNPGDGPSLPDAFGPIVGGTLVASQSGIFSVAAVSGLSGPYFEYVYQSSSPANVGYLCTGCLTYVLQVAVGKSGVQEPIIRITVNPFPNGVTTDVGFNSAGATGTTGTGTPPPTLPPTTGFAPDTVDRDPSGLIGFNFTGGNFVNGQFSSYLQIETNATAYVPGTISIISAPDSTTVSGFGAAPVPEPNALVLLVIGILGSVGLSRFQRKRAGLGSRLIQ